MSLHMQREMEHLKKHVLSLCAMVEEQVETAIRALLERDSELARRVESGDAEIDRREVEVEEECLKTLALYQPVAIDLRFVVGVLKMNSDLERVGDLAVNIAHKAASFAEKPTMEIPFDLSSMWESARAMLRDSIDSLVNRDAALAHSICRRDDEVDCRKRQNRKKAEQWMMERPASIPSMLALLAVSRNIERIADHATNIAEDVLYMVEGRIARHVTTEP